MIKSDIKSIQEFLEKQGMKCVYTPSSDISPFDQLYVPMGVDDQQRDLLLQIRVIEEDLAEAQQLFKLPSKPSKHHIVQLYCGLPFAVKPEHAGDVARLILLLNKSFGLPGFEFSEVDNLVYFRHVILAVEQLDELILMIIIGNMMRYIDTFSLPLERVGVGKDLALNSK